MFEAWQAAASQVIYSVGVGYGAIITLASYNRFHYNIWHHTVCIGIMYVNTINNEFKWYIHTYSDMITSALAGFIVFAMLGHVATVQRVNITDIIRPSPSLIFIAYPEAISESGDEPFTKMLFTAIYFIALILLGVDSQVRRS
jgi:SNF family Na+-dependent transporter